MTTEKFILPDEFSSEVQCLLMANEKSAGDIANDLVIWYRNLYQSYKLLYDKVNKKGNDFVLVSQPNFTLSYIENKPLFDGSDDTTEVFTVDTYQNYTLFETRQVPTSFLKVTGEVDADQRDALDETPSEVHSSDVL